MPRIVEIRPGDRFGKLTVIEEAGKLNKYRAFLLQCDCGKTKIDHINHLRRSKDPVRSCGCMQKAGNHRTHGLSKTPTYSVWMGMLTRCRNPNEKSYADYGGRGIQVCERWHKFENFLADMGEKPSARHEIDRIDNDGNYEPGNVRWNGDAGSQMRNRRKKAGTSKYRGVDWWKGRAWRARISINGKMRDLGLHTTEEAAAHAYDDAAWLRGFPLNFPEG